MKRKVLVFLVLSVFLSSILYPIHSEANSKANTAVATAKKLVGTPYLWGGTTPSGFDCSGFLRYVFADVGVTIPRTTIDQYRSGTSVARSDLKLGDMVFFKDTYRPGISHAGIYVGNNQFAHASSSSGVTITPLSNPYWNPKYAGAKRYIENEVQQQPAPKPKPSPKPEPPQEESIIATSMNLNQISGATRESTSVEISKEMYPNGFGDKHSSKTVIIATAYQFADALSAAPLSAKYENAPILLTQTKQLNSEVESEIRRLGAKKVIILGGEMAVSNQAMQQARQLVGQENVTRINGSNRFETNKKINEVVGDVGGYFVASGENPADALAAAPIAAQNNWGIVLTGSKKIDNNQVQMLQGKNVKILGGEMAISSQVEQQIKAHSPNAKRLSGTSRYDTLAEVLKAFQSDQTGKIFMATGVNFPDALAAAPLVSHFNGTLILVDKSVHQSLENIIKQRASDEVHTVGGVVPNSAINSLLRLVN